MADDDKGTGSTGRKTVTETEGAGSTAKPNETGQAAKKAKGEAKAVGAKARKAAGDVAENAKDAAAEVKDKTVQAAGDVVGTVKSELQGAMGDQKAAGAERAQRIADAIGRAGDELDEELPMVGDAMHRAAEEIEHFAGAVRDREPRELLDVAQDFARRQPALFAGAVGLAGFAAMRFLMASGSAGERSGARGDTSGSKDDDLFVPAGTGKTGATASGDPGGADPAAPGFGGSNAEPKGQA